MTSDTLATRNSSLMSAGLKNRKPIEELTITLSGRSKKALRLVDIVYLKSDGNAVDIFTADGHAMPIGCR